MCKKNKIRTASQQGFSLTELLVALAILALIMGVAAPRIIGQLSKSKTKTAQIQIEQFDAALEMFLLDTGRYPTSDEGLETLITNVNDDPLWSGPYLNKRATPLDPWGRSYRYDPSDASGPTVFSYGADGEEGGEGEDTDVYPS